MRLRPWSDSIGCRIQLGCVRPSLFCNRLWTVASCDHTTPSVALHSRLTTAQPAEVLESTPLCSIRCPWHVPGHAHITPSTCSDLGGHRIHGHSKGNPHWHSSMAPPCCATHAVTTMPSLAARHTLRRHVKSSRLARFSTTDNRSMQQGWRLHTTPTSSSNS